MFLGCSRPRRPYGACEHDNYCECVKTLADCRRFNPHRSTPTCRSSSVQLRRVGRCELAKNYTFNQWRSKALRGPGSTVTLGPSIPSAGPQGLKMEAQSAESGGGALGREGLLPGLRSGVSRQRQGFWYFLCSQLDRRPILQFFGPGLECPQELGAPVHWTTWTPGFYATAFNPFRGLWIQSRVSFSRFWPSSSSV